MKTGFTCGSGYNLIASAKRNGHRLIGVLLGAHSSAERFAQMGNLLDVGFENSRCRRQRRCMSPQLQDDDSAPPPFQLLYNRCAGSAQQMGADTGGSNQHEPINIQPGKKPNLIAKHDTNNWSLCKSATTPEKSMPNAVESGTDQALGTRWQSLVSRKLSGSRNKRRRSGGRSGLDWRKPTLKFSASIYIPKTLIAQPLP